MLREIIVTADGTLTAGRRRLRCSLGSAGVTRATREGDGATPAGVFAMRRLLWRHDRHPAVVTSLPASAIARDDGWCDAPDDPNYNRPVTLPYPTSAETMWRDDPLYDFVVVLGHNDAPVTAGAGSAVFLHVAAPDYGPTAGCVALAFDDLVSVLPDLSPATRLIVLAA